MPLIIPVRKPQNTENANAKNVNATEKSIEYFNCLFSTFKLKQGRFRDY